MVLNDYFFSVDPGNNCGIATWLHCELQAAYLVKGREQALDLFRDRHIGALVIEMPQAYVGRRSKGSGQDIVELAKFVGQLSAGFSETVYVLPSQWKGNLPKTVCKNRCKRVLSVAELALVTTEDNNVWDAIGIGLHHLGRLRVR